MSSRIAAPVVSDNRDTADSRCGVFATAQAGGSITVTREIAVPRFSGRLRRELF